MIDRALKILVFATMAMEVAARAASPSLQEDLEGKLCSSDHCRFGGGNASYHYYSSRRDWDTASFASLTNDGSGDFFRPIAPARPGDAAKRKTPSPESKELMQAPDLRAFDRTAMDSFAFRSKSCRHIRCSVPASSYLGSAIYTRRRDWSTCHSRGTRAWSSATNSS